MTEDSRYLFVSYAREDLDRVRPLVDAVKREFEIRALPVELWMDILNLKPGELWNVRISEALQQSIGFLFFVSPQSMHSGWVRNELELAAGKTGRLIIPIILQLDPDLPLPPMLAERQWIDLRSSLSWSSLDVVARNIADVAASYLELRLVE